MIKVTIGCGRAEPAERLAGIPPRAMAAAMIGLSRTKQAPPGDKSAIPGFSTSRPRPRDIMKNEGARA